MNSPKGDATGGIVEPVAPPLVIAEAKPEPSAQRDSGARGSGKVKLALPASPTAGDSGVLNLDQVISDYRERGEVKLELRVLAPDAFIAGKSIGLRVQVTHNAKPEFDAIVTVKIIGTAFKPQVVIGRVGRDGVASFSLAVPAFSAGTAAIVIEARSSTGRGELKNLIRRA
jgi:hypothetical protein